MPRSSNSWPGWAKWTTDVRSRRLSSRTRRRRRPGSARRFGRRRSCSGASVRESLIWREVRRERADRRADRHLVVVEHDQQLRLALADVVERLERQPAHQRRVADDDRDPLEAVAQVARLGQALGDRQAGAGVAAVEHVVGRLATAAGSRRRRRAGAASRSAQAAGQQLVRVGLVAGVPDDPVARRLEQPVQRDRQLDDARARSRGGRRSCATVRDDRLADLDARAAASWTSSSPRRSAGSWMVGQDRHGYELLGLTVGGTAAFGRADESADSHVMIGSCPRRSRMGRASRSVNLSLHRSLVSSTTTVRTPEVRMDGFVDRSAPRDARRPRSRRPTIPAIDDARATFNATIQRGRRSSSRCVPTTRSSAAVVAAGDLGLPIAVRGGGHSVAGPRDGRRRAGGRHARHARRQGRPGDADRPGPGRGALGGRRRRGLGPPSRGRRRHVRRHRRRRSDARWRDRLAVRARRLHLRQPDPGRGRDRGRRARRGRSRRRSRAALGAARRRRQLRRRDPFEFRAIDPGPIVAGYIHYPLHAARQVLRRLAEVAATAPDALVLTATVGAADRGRPATRARSGCAGRATRRRRPTSCGRSGRAPGAERHGRPDGLPRDPGDERTAAVRVAPLLEGPFPQGARRAADRRRGRGRWPPGRMASASILLEAIRGPARTSRRTARRSASGARPGTAARSRSGRTRPTTMRRSPGRARPPIGSCSVR